MGTWIYDYYFFVELARPAPPIFEKIETAGAESACHSSFILSSNKGQRVNSVGRTEKRKHNRDILRFSRRVAGGKH